MRASPAIVLAGAMIALALLLSGRFEIVTARGGLAFYRLDRLTGTTELCLPTRGPDANGEPTTNGSKCWPL